MMTNLGELRERGNFGIDIANIVKVTPIKPKGSANDSMFCIDISLSHSLGGNTRPYRSKLFERHQAVGVSS